MNEGRRTLGSSSLPVLMLHPAELPILSRAEQVKHAMGVLRPCGHAIAFLTTQRPLHGAKASSVAEGETVPPEARWL